MKTGMRMVMAAWAAALATAPMQAFAQNRADPAPEAVVGPEQLRDFSLKGTVTRRAEPQPSTTSRQQPANPGQSTRQPPATSQPTRAQPTGGTAARQPAPLEPRAPAPTVTLDLPPVTTAPPGIGNSSAPAFSPPPLPQPSPPTGAAVADESSESIPWLLLLLLAALAGGYYFFRQRSRLAFAGVDEGVNARVPAPSPEPQPKPAPAPRPFDPKPAPPSAGIVSSSLRPWIDIGFTPRRVMLATDAMTVEFDVELLNSGGAPAREVDVAVALFTANPMQDQEIEAFFAHPPAGSEPLQLLPPLKRLALSTSVRIGIDQLRLFQVEGRQMFVPIVALSARYRGASRDAQTGISVVVGRETQGEKLGPLRSDLGPRVFRNLGARQHNVGVRK